MNKTYLSALAVSLAVVTMTAGCTVNRDRSMEIIEANGFSQVVLGGPSLFGCSEDDNLTRTFRATAPNGARVQGVVCSGLLFKGATVRIDKQIAPPPVAAPLNLSAQQVVAV